MGKETIRGLLYVMFAAIFLFVILGCAKKPAPPLIVQAEPKLEKSGELETIGRMESIADALGCMFAPQSCSTN